MNFALGETLPQSCLDVSAEPKSLLSLFFFASEKAPDCDSLGCQFKCAVTHDGPRCYCRHGYEVAADGKTCKGRRFSRQLILAWSTQNVI